MTTTDTECKHCGRLIYSATLPRYELGDEIVAVWNLVYNPADPVICRARSYTDETVGALPHEPA